MLPNLLFNLKKITSRLIKSTLECTDKVTNAMELGSHAVISAERVKGAAKCVNGNWLLLIICLTVEL